MPIEEEQQPHLQSMASTTTTTRKLSPPPSLLSPPSPPYAPQSFFSSTTTTTTATTTTATTATFSPPPSASSSPSHDFTFTISLYPSPPCSSIPPKGGQTRGGSCSGGNSKKSSTAIDLSPADDIFFHGHLLPLHLLSRAEPPPISPRHSNASAADNLSTVSLETTTASDNDNHKQLDHISYNRAAEAGKADRSSAATIKPSKSFSFIFGKWRREADGSGEKETASEKKEPSSTNSGKKKRSFDVGRILKRYATMVEALLFSGRSSATAREKKDLRRRPYSFSGTSNLRREAGRGSSGEECRRRAKKRWGEFSAPASMRTSPTNSGLLVATGANFGSSEESTMEELQNAIQAAIAHCKSSVAIKEENTTTTSSTNSSISSTSSSSSSKCK